MTTLVIRLTFSGTLYEKYKQKEVLLNALKYYTKSNPCTCACWLLHVTINYVIAILVCVYYFYVTMVIAMVITIINFSDVQFTKCKINIFFVDIYI